MLGVDEPSDTDIDANLRDEAMSCTRGAHSISLAAYAIVGPRLERSRGREHEIIVVDARQMAVHDFRVTADGAADELTREKTGQ